MDTHPTKREEENHLQKGPFREKHVSSQEGIWNLYYEFVHFFAFLCHIFFDMTGPNGTSRSDSGGSLVNRKFRPISTKVSDFSRKMWWETHPSVSGVAFLAGVNLIHS